MHAAPALEARISTLAPRFDLPALMDALQAAGYRSEQILFRSQPRLCHAAALVQSVEFQREPRRAIVLLNLGLLNSQGPLPMYFFRLLSEQRDNDMTELMWFFDQHLLAQRGRALMPERDTGSMPGWKTTRQGMLLLVRLASPSGVHWLLEHVFPDLEVVVRRTAGERTLRTQEFCLAESLMGQGATLGGLTTLPVDGTEALLLCSEEAAATPAEYIDSVQERLRNEVLPLLSEQNPYLFLRVYLVFRGALGRVGLASDRHLGVNRIYASGSAREEIEQLLLWNGEVRSALNSEFLNFQLSAGGSTTTSERRASSGRKARGE